MHRLFFSKRKRMKAIEELVRINFEEDTTPIVCIKDAKIKPLSEGVAIYAGLQMMKIMFDKANLQSQRTGIESRRGELHGV